jgi:hypothetical protein
MVLGTSYGTGNHVVVKDRETTPGPVSDAPSPALT